MHHASGIRHGADEFERIERNRYALFALLGLGIFLALMLLLQVILWAALLAASLALLASGWYVAHAMTRAPAWSILEAEGRLDGNSPSKRTIWMANLLPGAISLAASIVWLSGA